jgi:hypothetical protein
VAGPLGRYNKRFRDVTPPAPPVVFIVAAPGAASYRSEYEYCFFGALNLSALDCIQFIEKLFQVHTRGIER